MYNKVLWSRMFFVFLVSLMHTNPIVQAQKKWDGGGGDSLWNNPLNWHPDGIPTAADTVILDNQWLASSFKVFFPEGMNTSHVFSICIAPSEDRHISLTLPNTNTASPGLTLYSTDTALKLYNRSIFYNSSGASAGNAIALSGKFKINSGGKYVHQTQRGNASLVASLVADPETKEGVFEFNVPGNSAYILSASGRTFGNLVLSGPSTIRKTYTTSGSNQLLITGDLLINEQATLSTSLTNNIVINGNMLIKGRLNINPVSADTTGRCLLTMGNHKKIEVTGQFNQGIHFRKWLIGGSYLLNNSKINMDQPSGKIHFLSESKIDLGQSSIKGQGEYLADSNTTFLSSASCIIGTDTTCNIQIEQVNLHPKTGFIFYGNQLQYTGNRFPTVISKLKIDKPQENIYLTNSIVITDSLCLQKGIIISKDNSIITIKHYSDPGNDNSYFTGKLIHSSNQLILHFPIGNKNAYLPAVIKRSTISGYDYQIFVDSLTTIQQSYPTLYPVRQLTTSTYYSVSMHQKSEDVEQAQLIFLRNQIGESDCLVELDTTTHQWKLISTGASDSIIANLLSVNSPQIITMGKLNPIVLPLSKIVLQKTSIKNGLMLNWTVDDDENADYYQIQASVDGIYFATIESIPSLNQKGPTSFTRKIKQLNRHPTFYRIGGIDKDGRKILSNTVYAKEKILTNHIFPNPTNNSLYIISSEKTTPKSIVDSYGKHSPFKFNRKDNLIAISVAHLPAGNYFLLLEHAQGFSSLPFSKQ